MAAAVLDFVGPPYVQRAVVELLLLSVLAGVLGSWVILRRLAFYSHAVGTAAFPGLVVAGPFGLPAQVAALGTALVVSAGVSGLGRTRRLGVDVATGLMLVLALAVGVILASDVYGSGSGVDRLLFGSLLSVSARDVWVTAALCAAIVLLDAVFRRGWLLQAFDAESARASGLRTGRHDLVLYAAIAVGAVLALDAVGALMVSAILVVPAATARLITSSVSGLRAAATGLAAVEGVAALLLARELDVGPGAVLAVLSSAVFAAVACGQRLVARGVS